MGSDHSMAQTHSMSQAILFFPIKLASVCHGSKVFFGPSVQLTAIPHAASRASLEILPGPLVISPSSEAS